MVLLREILEKLTAAREELKKLEQETQKALAASPEGTMHVSVHNGQCFYSLYVGRNSPRKNVSRKNTSLLRAYGQKYYDTEFLQTVRAVSEQIDQATSLLDPDALEQVYEQLPEARKKLTIPRILTDEQFVEEWLSLDYFPKEFREGEPEYVSMKGERVRSKTEKIIADTLYHMNVPYRYEFPLSLKGLGTVYPDFTILKVKTRETLIWEHCGMMDSQEYCDKFLKKMESYGKNGYYTGKNLILTFESSTNPINTAVLTRMITDLLLDDNH